MFSKTGYSLIQEEKAVTERWIFVKIKHLFSLIYARPFLFTYLVATHVALAILLVKASLVDKQRAHPCLLDSELLVARDAISYEAITFDPSGFSTSNDPPNKFEGPPNDENNQAWHDLINVGMVVLSANEYNEMDIETAEIVDRPGEYLVTVEMFHQLHCLDYLRQASWAFEEGLKTHHHDESGWSKRKHINHCVDYLRQVLMCHGDLTPITLEHISVPGAPSYLPNFHIKHTCRNFERIYDFAASRNSSGYGIA